MELLQSIIGYRCGQMVVELLQRGLRPSDILTRQAFDNAIAGVAASGGSTNGVLHLLAMARRASVDFTLDDLDELGRTLVAQDAAHHDESHRRRGRQRLALAVHQRIATLLLPDRDRSPFDQLDRQLVRDRHVPVRSVARASRSK